MRWRYLGLACLLCIVLLFRDGWALATRFSLSIAQGSSAPTPHDAESLIARMETVPLACASLLDLELIPGVTDRVASSLIERREWMLSNAALIGEQAVLEHVHGVGPALAHTLLSFISLRHGCPHPPSGPPLKIIAAGLSRDQGRAAHQYPN